MNSAIVFAVVALVASASANTSPVTEEQQQQQQQHQQQYAQESVMQPVAINALPIDVYGRQAYRAVYAVANNNEDQKQSGSAVQGGEGVGVYRTGNYVAVPYPVQAQVAQYPVAVHPVGSPLGIGARLGGSIHISPAARGFALGGLTGLGVGLASRGLLAGSLAGPLGLGIHGALSTPALGVGLGAGAAALLG